GLLQDAQDLTVGVAGRLHVKSPRLGLRENSTFQNNLLLGGLPFLSGLQEGQDRPQRQHAGRDRFRRRAEVHCEED
ncbi:hypothetical protein, partial [Fundidesulfovibrio agrisoli]|uniref:hypothetical protein n=1 Tax=Fundidesulfovibrio agrisoli TaxID=2922717 RepID=UPI001FACACD8